MIIGIVGAGAVGGYVGAKLASAKQEIIFLARGEHLAAMRRSGLWLRGTESFAVEGTYTDAYEAMQEAGLVVFAVKSTEMREAAARLQTVLKPDTCVLTLQNGVDNEEILAEMLPSCRILSGAAYLTSTIEEPGVIRQEGPAHFVIGSIRKTDEALAEQALGEAVAVGERLGMQTSHKVIDGIFPAAEKARQHKTSMLQDREKGKKMEVESLCGYFVCKGRALQIELPVLGTLYAILSSVDRKERMA